MEKSTSLVLFFFFLFTFINSQYQQCAHLSGSTNFNPKPIFGTTNVYDKENTIGGISYAFSFVLNESNEIMVMFGRQGNGPGGRRGRSTTTDQVWKYDLNQTYWKFIRGRKSGYNQPIFEENNLHEFNKSIQIGSRQNIKGWFNQKDNIVNIFGGTACIKNDKEGCTNYYNNEFWQYNITSNSYAVLNYNKYENGAISQNIRPQFTGIKGTFNEKNYPSGRSLFELLEIPNEKVIIIGGHGYTNKTCREWGVVLDDIWIYSKELMQWSLMMGSSCIQEVEFLIYRETNVYHQNNTLGTVYYHSGVLVNEEEILIFGGIRANWDIYGNKGSSVSNVIQKYNISSNMIKYISGNTTYYEYPTDYSREYNASSVIGSRRSHQMWKINDDELLLFGGWGYSETEGIGLLSDEHKYNIKTDQWKFTGKLVTRYVNRYKKDYAELKTDRIIYYPDATIGGNSHFVGHYLPEKKSIILIGGDGYSYYQRGNLDDVWIIYMGSLCGTYQQDDENVCSGRGKCLSHNLCRCDIGFYGDNCELTKCHNILSNETDVCSNNGICQGKKCLCYATSIYINPDCSINESLESFVTNLWLFITIPIVIILTILLFIVLVSIFIYFITKLKTDLKRFDEIEDIELVLEEQKINRDTSIAHLNINKKLFEIDPKDVKIDKQIGQGGSSAIVYLATWNQQKVAYKCFSVNDFMGTNKFKEFEKEVQILASVNYPHILNFFGATLNTNRLGFVMEFAEYGDLENFLKSYKMMNRNTLYPMKEKLRMLYEISSAMLFLHSKEIIHRDLKLQNVLVTGQEETKLMDFGMSSFVENDKTRTKRVGTSFFIAPEVLNGHYSYPCDVYSFSFLAFIVLSEKFNPFGNKANNITISLRTGADPNFRPDMNELELLDLPNDLKGMIKRNWNHDPSKRMTFKEIAEFLKNKFEEKKKSENKIPEKKDLSKQEIQLLLERIKIQEKEIQDLKDLNKSQQGEINLMSKELKKLKEVN